MVFNGISLAIAENEMEAYPQCTRLRRTRSGRLSNVDHVQSLLAQRRRGPPRKREQKVNEENKGGKELSNEPRHIRGLRIALSELWYMIFVTAALIAVTQ